MKVVLFCGGDGTRIREASAELPKPLIKINDLPILFYVMASYAKKGHTDFILCAGYKKEEIDKYVKNLINGNLKIRIKEWLSLGYPHPSSWTVNVIDTGNSCIGERLWKVRHLVAKENYFFANYADVISKMDVNWALEDLKENQAICSFASVKPSQFYHWCKFDDDGKKIVGLLESFELELWINGGFMCLTPEIFNYMNPGEELVFEPFSRLMGIGKISSYKSNVYWRSIDTYKDLIAAQTEINLENSIIYL